jgi:hypothetical protein
MPRAKETVTDKAAKYAEQFTTDWDLVVEAIYWMPRPLQRKAMHDAIEQAILTGAATGYKVGHTQGARSRP